VSAHDSVRRMLKQRLQEFRDFPEQGVLFQDLSGVYATPGLVGDLASMVVERYRGEFDHVAAIEARGFVLGTAVAQAARAPLVLVRKAGKLPGRVHSRSYQCEYAAATLQLQHDAIATGARVLLVDDVLATGGTLKAAAQLIEDCGGTIAGLAVLLELFKLKGRWLVDPYPLFSIHRPEG
jgi:adenine phosphoribosyltransferase